MEEQLVSFETAKLAKEVGFDWKVTHHYRGNELAHNGTYYNFNSPEEQELWNIELASAPTRSLLQKWLREERDFILYVMPMYIEDDTLVYKCNALDCYIQEQRMNYGDALEAGLQEALKIIKDAKQ